MVICKYFKTTNVPQQQVFVDCVPAISCIFLEDLDSHVAFVYNFTPAA